MRLWRDGEEGATSTMFVVSLTALLAVALLAVDGGYLFVSRRGQVADTDAGALAAANWLIENPCAASQSIAEAAANTEATTIVATNDPGTTVELFDVTWDTGSTCAPSGVVTVDTRRESSLFFAPIFGYSGLTTGVETKVRFGQLSGVGGVKPLGFCASDSHYAEWRAYLTARDLNDTVGMAAYEALKLDPVGHSNALYPGATNVVHRIDIEPASGSSCAASGSGNGNWGWIDFDGTGGGGGAGNAEFRDRLLNGYPPGVDLGDAGTADNDCDAADADTDLECPGRPGAGGASFDSELQALVDDCPPNRLTSACEPLFAVVYDQTTNSGANVRYRLVGLVQFQIRGFSTPVTGRPAPGDWLDIEFVQERTDGSVGTPDPNSAAPPDTDLCGTGTADNC